MKFVLFGGDWCHHEFPAMEARFFMLLTRQLTALNQARRRTHMAESSRYGHRSRTGGLLAATGLLMLSGAALATDQSQQRQQGRDANQGAKQDARSGKVDCRAENQKSNSACRQDK